MYNPASKRLGIYQTQVKHLGVYGWMHLYIQEGGVCRSRLEITALLKGIATR